MKFKSKNEVSAAFSMSSLTDIIFLLLIFFMLTSTLVSPNAIKLLLPNATGQTLSNQTISLSVTDKLEYFLDDRPIKKEALSVEIKKAVAGLQDPIPTVVLRVDKRVDVENLVDVLKVGNELKVRMILATKPE